MGKEYVIIALFMTSFAHGLDFSSYEQQTEEFAEYTLYSAEGVWMYDELNRVADADVVPLRLVSPNLLLVYGSTDSIRQAGYVAHDSSGVMHNDASPMPSESIDRVRLVFEPNLPSSVKYSLMNTIVPSLQVDSEFYTVPYPSSIEFDAKLLDVDLVSLSLLPGVLWVEPVLETKARNDVSSSLLQHGHTTEFPAWDFGLNGHGVVIGIGDSGIDADHACFRQYTDSSGSTDTSSFSNNSAIGVFSPEHRKIAHYNTTLDGYDSSSHLDYRHGTHVAGTLACHDVFHNGSTAPPSNGSALAFGSQIVFQDLVSSEGWVVPDVDELLHEGLTYGAIIHSNSWGDDTTNYTVRTATFDAFARQVPWSLAFIAPGNNAGDVLEPANGRNVVAVGATVKSTSQELWSPSARGPLHDGRDGIFVIAPGQNIMSAKADGNDSTNNAELRPSSGTSMSTPSASGATAIIQQMYQDGWFSNHVNRTRFVSIDQISAEWVNFTAPDHSGLFLSDGITPSASLLKATLALSTTPYEMSERNGGAGSTLLHNPYEGWGVINLSELVDFQSVRLELEVGNTTPAPNFWYHDSFELTETDVNSWYSALPQPMNHSWNGSGARGPFLTTGDSFTTRLLPVDGEDVQLRLSFPAKPEPELVDDLLLVAHLSNGKTVVRDLVDDQGHPIQFSTAALNTSNQTLIPATNETTSGIYLPSSLLENVSFIDVEVKARFVTPGLEELGVGLSGSRVGFALVAQGVQPHEDQDGDGIQNANDMCPDTLSGEVVDEDGCSESQLDDDADGVFNIFDACPMENASGFDLDFNGCIDDSDADGYNDQVDQCPFEDHEGYPVDGTGCVPVDNPPLLRYENIELFDDVWMGNLTVQWNITDIDGDPYETGAIVHEVDNPNFIIAACFYASNDSRTFLCTWNNPNDIPPYSLDGMTFQVRIHVQSKNSSPFAHHDFIEHLVPETFVVHWDNPLGENPTLRTESQGVSSRVMLWGFVSIVLGFGIAYRFTRVLSEENNTVDDPFFKNSENTSIFGKNGVLDDDE